MAAEVAWTLAAADDLRSIAEYIERDSPHYAAAVVGRIVELVAEAAQHPLAGRVVPEFGRDDVRERFVYSYRVVYRVTAERVIILGVIHGRRDYRPEHP